MYTRAILALILFILLLPISLPGQQRIAPVINYSIEREQVHPAAVHHTEVIDSVFYFAFDSGNPESVYASNGTADGTRQVSTHDAPGGEVIYGFAHGSDYYYVVGHYQNATQLRRANYQEKSDALVTELPGRRYNSNFSHRDLGASRTMVTISDSDTTYLYLLEGQRQFRPVLTLARRQANAEIYLGNVHVTADRRVLLELGTYWESKHLVALDLNTSVLDTLLEYPSTSVFEQSQLVNDHLYLATQVDRALTVFVYTTEG